MTKWYDTNYHNLTPEIDASVLAKAKERADFSDFLALIREAQAVCGSSSVEVAADVIGPVTLVERSMLSGVTFAQAVDALVPLYSDLLR